MVFDLVISIVTYNNENVVPDAIKSIIEHTKDINYQIVVYDNCSTDNTINKIHEIADERITVINNKDNRGFGYGHNKVIQQFKAGYYLIYNPDVFLENDILGEMYAYMEKNTDVGMITPKVCYPNGEIQYLCKQNPAVFDLFFRRFIPASLKTFFQKRSDYYEMRSTGYNKEFLIPYATGCFMFFRGSVLHEIHGFDDNIFMYLEDADITRRTNQVSKCIFYPYSSITHLWGKGSHKSLRLTWINIKSAIYYFNKWGWKFW